MIRDKDGSLGAGPNAYVLINDGVNDSIATDAQACEIKPTWNAAVCKGDVGRLALRRRRESAAVRRRSRSAVLAHRALPGAPAAALLVPQWPVHSPRSSSAAGRSQPQWQGLPDRRRRHQRARRHRDQADHRKADRGPQRDGAGQRLVGDLRSCRASTRQPRVQQQNSLDALRKASDTSYFKDKDALWVKVVSLTAAALGLGGATTLQVSR